MSTPADAPSTATVGDATRGRALRLIEAVADMRAASEAWADPARVSLVPTMGYLHAGHLALVRAARAENATVVASIFVNPTQFGPHEDLARYPRDLPRDLALLEAAGVDLVFVPSAAEMYPAGFVTYVAPEGALGTRLEAASRPMHFRGVCTVVLKLFNLVRPSRAYFGQKDAQQVAVLRRMVADLNVPVALHAQPTVREADGLALSSRNAYLGPDDRAAATVLVRALEAGRMALDRGADAASVRRAMEALVAAEPRATLEYAAVCDPASFEPLAELAEARAPALLAIAARVGPARLMDNFLRRPDGDWEVGARLPASAP